MYLFHHDYPFDPSYGYNSLHDLFAVQPPAPPADFAEYWRKRYRKTLAFATDYEVVGGGNQGGYLTFDIFYRSTGGVTISGWLLIPEDQPVYQAIIVGHGYGGRDEPDYHLNIPGAALLFPCFRGLARSRFANLSENPEQHVLYGIEHPDNYILGGCIEDLWVAVTVIQQMLPQVRHQIGYMGISFGGGIGALATPWDHRIKRAHFNVPTFGHQPLRLLLPTIGSAAALQSYDRQQPYHVIDTLSYYDAASAARFARQPAHFALATFDPVVAPPGQFAIYNTWAAEKHYYLLEAGHFDYPNKIVQEQQLLEELKQFFGEVS